MIGNVDAAADPVTQRSALSIDIETGLRRDLVADAAGRVLVIDYWASHRCGVVTGDLTAAFQVGRPERPYLELEPIEGVRVFAEERLVGLLATGGPRLRRGGLAFARHLSVDLARPELWLDFLSRPGVMRGKFWKQWGR